MRTVFSIAFLALLFLLLPTHVSADEVSRLNVDLDGDGNPEAVRMSIAPAKENRRRRFTVRIGDSEYSDSYFSEHGLIP